MSLCVELFPGRGCMNYSINRCSRIVALLVVALSLLGLGGQSALSQTTWEFSGTPYTFQKAHFDSATHVVLSKLGVRMHTFGAPYNQIDTTFIRVMSEDTSYKVLLYGQLSPAPSSGQINLTNRVFIESATGVPDYAYFLTSWYAKKGIYTDYMVMQGHPYAWTTPEKLAEFQTIINFLIATDSVVFTTPTDYYRYLTDTTIARTNKIQVMLKLDDLRATTSYFYPCLPTYDFLAAHQVKAGFGVNKLEALTQAQIDTLHYYLNRTNGSGEPLFEIWNHGLDHSMTAGTTGGNWSSPATWPDGYVPTAADDAVIPAGVTITLDSMNAVCNNLIVNGTLLTSTTTATSLVVNGDVLINAGGSFTSPSLTGATANIFHTLTVYGDFTNAGGTFDFRTGSAGTTLRAINTTFAGSYNSIITVGTYSTSNNNFNSITINKTNGARVICASDVVCDPGSSTGRSQLVLTSGLVETGANVLYVLSTTTADILTPGPASYVVGALGRGMSNSAGKTCTFPVGDAGGYRTISVTSTTAGVVTGHNVVVRCVSGDANAGGSTLVGGIDAVSKVRYYQISYNKGLGAAASSMSFNRFWPSYGSDDGVLAGNTDLRTAVSSDARATWTKINQSLLETTTLSNPPVQVHPDSLPTPITLVSGVGSIHIALADTVGGVNPLGRTNAIFVIDSLSLNFGQVAVGSSKQDSVTVSNSGGMPLRITGVTSPNPSFSIMPTAANIPAGGSARFAITFTPPSNGLQSAVILFSHNASGSPSQIPVSGVGVSAIFTARPAHLSFGSLSVGMSRVDSVAIVNEGNIALVLTAFANSNPDQFTVAGSAPVTIAASDSTWIHVTFHPTATGTHAAALSIRHNSSSSPDTLLLEGSGTGTVSLNVDLLAGWNMISTPTSVANDSLIVLFPSSLFPYAFSFNPGTGYAQQRTLTIGPAYWGKFPSITSQTIVGYPLMRDSIPVAVGWNMIGSISCTIDTGSIVSSPGGLRGSNWFAYGSSGYVIANQIQPGHGYWVKSTGNGHFLLNCGPVAKSASGTIPSLSAILNSVTISDAHGNAQTLYFGCDPKEELIGMNFDLPPAPPGGAFDARFENVEGGTLARIHSSRIASPLEFPIAVSADSYPLTVRWDVSKGTGQYELTDGTTPAGRELRGTGSLTLGNNSLRRLAVRLVGDGQAPTQFVLDQNYPNPFNPSTLIRYGIPVDSRVSIEVFDVLGQRVRVLLRGEKVASYHVIEWNGMDDNGTQLAAGIYFVRVAGTGMNGAVFSGVRKVMLLR
jgi:hypothetical protein